MTREVFYFFFKNQKGLFSFLTDFDSDLKSYLKFDFCDLDIKTLVLDIDLDLDLKAQVNNNNITVILCVCRDGIPYCEADYHTQFGIRCESCSRYISGRVLEVRTVGRELYTSMSVCLCRTDGNVCVCVCL